MIIKGKLEVNAPIQKVWDTLFDTEALVACIPGAEAIEQVDEKNYNCIIKQKVGPISVRFKVKINIMALSPPNYIELDVDGEDRSKLNHINQKSVVILTECSDNKVEISYNSTVKVTGKLSMFGDRILKAKAKQIEGEFTRALSEKLRKLT